MVCAKVASLASWSQLWSPWLSQQPSCVSEAAVSPSLVLSLPITVGCMLYGLERSRSVSNYQCSFVPYIQLCCAGRCCSNLGQPFKSHFKSIKKLTLFLRLQYAVANGLERSLNISNPLEMPLEMLCVSSITVKIFLHSKSCVCIVLEAVSILTTNLTLLTP